MRCQHFLLRLMKQLCLGNITVADRDASSPALCPRWRGCSHQQVKAAKAASGRAKQSAHVSYRFATRWRLCNARDVVSAIDTCSFFCCHPRRSGRTFVYRMGCIGGDDPNVPGRKEEIRFHGNVAVSLSSHVAAPRFEFSYVFCV